ncbi:MAG TPA: rhomboid family intramembrane serine protease, partial [Vicinamibacterales bacterium]|nr:rhomboid family intramembrane serine protease [Vicinamibacterales bacterium]
MVTLVGLLLVAGLVFYAIAPEARDQLIRVVVGSIGLAKHEATRVRPECERFRAALRERTPRAVATPALVALNLGVFVLMLFGGGTFGDAKTLVDWGGNSWLQTRNGEWWRLITAIFVHTGLLHLLVNVAGFVQISLILERLVGPAILVAVFVIAGVFGNLVNLVAHPMTTSVGASGAAYGLYGLLFASAIWGHRHRSSVTIPLTVIKQLSPAAAVFFLYNLVTDSVGSSGELAALVVGLVCGGVLTREVSEHKPATRRVAHTMAGALVLAVLSAIPLRGVTDVRPELERTLATEDRTADAYRKASDRFKSGQMTANALAGLIDKTIVPELQVSEARLKALTGVPESHQPLVATAEEYVQLRLESWRLRAEW